MAQFSSDTEQHLAGTLFGMQTVASSVKMSQIFLELLSSLLRKNLVFIQSFGLRKSTRVGFFFTHPKKRKAVFVSSSLLVHSPLFWPQPKRPPWLIAYWVRSLYIRAWQFSLHTVLVSLTVTISILKRQGQFPPYARIWLYNLIAKASPVSPAPASGLFFPRPPCVSSLTPPL